ncbi:MAG: hypothetical protein JWN41_1788, partial [Thermoleophilia bacterium]|nr:hypothetical protein [Thermoleophilia bacterium]
MSNYVLMTVIRQRRANRPTTAPPDSVQPTDLGPKGSKQNPLDKLEINEAAHPARQGHTELGRTAPRKDAPPTSADAAERRAAQQKKLPTTA